MFNFGPATIKFNDVVLGDTVEGGHILPQTIVTEDVDILGNYFYKEELVGGRGYINFFQWDSDLDLGDSTELTDWGVLTISCPKMAIKLWRCKLLFDLDMDFGRLNQTPIKINFIFGKDSSGKIISVKEAL